MNLPNFEEYKNHRPRDNCCLQYHTGCVGRIETFNFGNQNDNHLNNQQ